MPWGLLVIFARLPGLTPVCARTSMYGGLLLAWLLQLYFALFLFWKDVSGGCRSLQSLSDPSLQSRPI